MTIARNWRNIECYADLVSKLSYEELGEFFNLLRDHIRKSSEQEEGTPEIGIRGQLVQAANSLGHVANQLSLVARSKNHSQTRKQKHTFIAEDIEHDKEGNLIITTNMGEKWCFTNAQIIPNSTKVSYELDKEKVETKTFPVQIEHKI